MSRQILVAVVIIAVLGAALGGYYLVTGGFNPTVPVNDVPVEGTQPSDGAAGTVEAGVDPLAAAAEIYAYIQTQRREDGFYDYASNCGDGCPFVGAVFKNANTWPTYAAVGMYQATGDDGYLADARRDADKMIEWCAEDQKECVRVTYQVNELYKETKDERYADFVKSEADVLIDPVNQEFIGTDMPMLLAIDSLQLAQVYEMTNDEKYLDAAVSKLTSADSNMEKEMILYAVDDRVLKTYACWPELASIEIYKATGDRAYLDRVVDFIDDLRIADNVHQMWYMTDVQPCMDLYVQLGSITGDGKYTLGALSIMNHILDNYWDSKANPKVSGGGSIKSTKDQNDSGITDSAYMVWLLAKISAMKMEAV